MMPTLCCVCALIKVRPSEREREREMGRDGERGIEGREGKMARESIEMGIYGEMAE